MDLKKIFLFMFVTSFLTPATPLPAVTDAGSELRRFDDEELERKMKAMLESDTEPVIQFADEPAESAPKPDRNKT